MRYPYILAAAAALASPLAAQTSGTKTDLSAGIEYKEGEYGTGQRIETISAPIGLRLSSGQFQFGATLPYLRIDAPGNVVGGGGLLGLPIIVDPTQPATRQRREGIGDLRLGAAYTVPMSSVGLTFSSEVKLPTASAAKGLGTGEVDYSVGAELSKAVGRVTPFLGIGYSLPGDPEGYELRNSLSARAGAVVRMSPQVRGHVSYGYAQSVSPLVPDEQQVATGLNASLSPRLSLGVYGSAGLSEGAPDIGAGLQIGFQID